MDRSQAREDEQRELSRPFSVSIRCRGAWVSVMVEGELDLATAPILEDSLYPFRHRLEPFLFNLGGVRFIDVVGIKPILRRCERDDARIGVTSHSVRNLLRLLGDEIEVERWLADGHPTRLRT